jgi:hypothetical protein
MARARFGLVFFLYLVAACGGPAPTSSPMASSTPRPTAEPTPAFATVPPLEATPLPEGAPADRSLPTSASTEFGRVRLTLSLDMNPLDANAGAEALVTIHNRSHRTLEWGVDGCDINAWVDAKTDATWRDSTLELSEHLAQHRDELRRIVRMDQPIRLGFLRPIFMQNRNIGCSDLALHRELRPGRSVTQSFTWDGSAGDRFGPAPTGPVTFTSRFERWKLAGGSQLRPLEVELESWVLRGRRQEFLSPLEAIDAAFTDERFTAWLLTRPAESNANPVVEYDREIGAWVVGLLIYKETPSFQEILHAAYIDPYSGEVFAVKESQLRS